MRFAHVADAHLGYRQYNSNERRDDFALAFSSCIDIIIQKKCDFVVFAGDMFHIKDPLWVDIIFLKNQLKKLSKKNISFYGIRGNHDAPRVYDKSDWLNLYDNIFDVDQHINSVVYGLNNHTVTGLNWRGINTKRDLLSQINLGNPVYKDKFNILLLHAGVEGVLSGAGFDISKELLLKLKNNPFHYIGLGHIHKPYVIDDFIFNPGSLEACSSTEQEYKDRGIFIVDVNKDMTYTSTKHIIRGRAFFDVEKSTIKNANIINKAIIRYSLNVDESEIIVRADLKNMYDPTHVIFINKNKQETTAIIKSSADTVDDIYDKLFKDNLYKALKAQNAIINNLELEAEIFS